MSFSPNLHGITALIAGIDTLSLIGWFFFLNGGFVPVASPSNDPIANRGLFITCIVFAHLLPLETPLLDDQSQILSVIKNCVQDTQNFRQGAELSYAVGVQP